MTDVQEQPKIDLTEGIKAIEETLPMSPTVAEHVANGISNGVANGNGVHHELEVNMEENKSGEKPEEITADTTEKKRRN